MADLFIKLDAFCRRCISEVRMLNNLSMLEPRKESVLANVAAIDAIREISRAKLLPLAVRSTINEGALLCALPPAVFVAVASHLNVRDNLALSGACSAIRKILAVQPQIWSDITTIGAPPDVISAIWGRLGPEDAVHLHWIEQNQSSLQAVIRDNKSRLSSLRFTCTPQYTYVGPSEITDFLLSYHRLSPIPRTTLDWATASPHETNPVSFSLHTLEIDCGQNWDPRPGWHTLYDLDMNWHLLWQLPADLLGDGTNLRRCLLRGIAYPTGAIAAFGNLTEFAYCGQEELTPDMMDEILRGMPRLDSLSLTCQFHAQGPFSSTKGLARPSKVVLGLFSAVGAISLLNYALSRGFPDIVFRDLVLDGPIELDITALALDIHGQSYWFQDKDGHQRRIRVSLSGINGNYLAPANSILSSSWTTSVVEMTTDESLWENLCAFHDDIPPITLPQLATLRICLGSEWDRQRLGVDSTSLGFFFSEARNPGPAPNLRVFEIWGSPPTHPDSSMKHIRQSANGHCLCCASRTVSLGDLSKILTGFHLVALERIGVFGIECVDIDLAEAV
ncbi:hypothetical protein BKA62DRAFT_702862 [Auriculariales sp. MPI-PUGE-AT-0066]|nr:hypothetical protein BKA62DRAFT_702862 [Auriculariales sp. MPI-PUGE-AT-0066]